MSTTPRAYAGMELLSSRRQRENIAPILEGDQYPQSWRHFVGQEPAKRMLQVAAKSARLRKQPLEHVLIAHPTAGVGKTALAALIAKEMRRTCRVISGKVSANKARLILSEMKDQDLLLYDEFHQIMDGGKKNAEWILHLLQDGALIGPRGPEPQPKVTIIAATTDATKLPDTIVSRFPLQPPMQDYTHDEATKIVLIHAKDILSDLPPLTKRDAGQVAAAAHNNPRAIRRLLINLRDMTITKELPIVNGRYDINGMLAWAGITPDGLDIIAQRYLALLASEFDGSAGARAMEDRLQQPGGLAATERVLMDKGFIAKTRTGRTITQEGIARYQELIS